jgi:hypothetical protein
MGERPVKTRETPKELSRNNPVTWRLAKWLY